MTAPAMPATGTGATSAPVTTVGEWMARIEPAPPAALHRRMGELLAADAERPVREVAEACLDAGERLLDALLASGSTSRATALDLLAVDALITYAFQAAADDPSQLEARAARAMARIAALPGAMRG